MKHEPSDEVNSELVLLQAARHHAPHRVLGPHVDGTEHVVRVFDPYARKITLEWGGASTVMRQSGGLFEWRASQVPANDYQLRVDDGPPRHDAYAFAPEIGADDLYLFNEGRLLQAYRILGAHARLRDGVAGVRFAVWAPNAERVSIVGDFNRWDGRCHPMATHGASGVWELFVPGLSAGQLYKYEIRNRNSGAVVTKTDPYARSYELRPGTAARVPAADEYVWGDAQWLEHRARSDWLHAPFNVYELHVGSWRRHPGNRVYSYRELADHLVPYVRDMAYTHIELLPISEHPLDESWGYQSTGYFAPTSRFGTPEDLKYLIDQCHQAGIGVLLDWVPAHFPQDAFALARFDGTALYEHEDPRLGLHQDWGTHIFNYGRSEVRSFLLSSAHLWLEEFHFDGLRVDAVASMLYLDYSRKPGEWLPNRFGGRENLDAVDFLRALNVMVHEEFAGALTIAEESTAWPAVSRPTYLGGLGFSMKWNMGWMNDTLRYLALDPVFRRFHQELLTFGQLYAYSENFLLPLSHDEVVHGKRSLLDKMPGDAWQRFANLRLLLTYQMMAPGKKLVFMGDEFGQGREWRDGAQLDWFLLDTDWHRGVMTAARDLNRLYRDLPALHEQDFSPDGFAWIDCHDADQSVISFRRTARDGSFAVAILNFTPVTRDHYRIGVPQGGRYDACFNSDSRFYCGSDCGNGAQVEAEEVPWMGHGYSLLLRLPPLAGIVFIPGRGTA